MIYSSPVSCFKTDGSIPNITLQSLLKRNQFSVDTIFSIDVPYPCHQNQLIDEI